MSVNILQADGLKQIAGNCNGSDPPMVGATETQNGQSGTVPAPLAGQQSAHLQGDGTWDDTVYLSGENVTTETNVEQPGKVADATLLNKSNTASPLYGMNEDILNLQLQQENYAIGKGITLSVTADGILAITYDDGQEE